MTDFDLDEFLNAREDVPDVNDEPTEEPADEPATDEEVEDEDA